MGGSIYGVAFYKGDRGYSGVYFGAPIWEPPLVDVS